MPFILLFNNSGLLFHLLVRFIRFWLRGDAAFVDPQVYRYCESERVTYFIRLPANAVLNRLIDPDLTRPVGPPPKSGI